MMYVQTKTGLASTLRYVFWDKEKDIKVYINRTGDLVNHYLEDFKIDPANNNHMFIAFLDEDYDLGVVRLNVQTGAIQTTSRVIEPNLDSNYIRINEACTHFTI